MKEGIGCLVILVTIFLGWWGVMEIKWWWQGGQYDTIQMPEEAYLCFNNQVKMGNRLMGMQDPKKYQSYKANFGDKVILIEKIQYILVPNKDEITPTVPTRPNKEFLDALDYDVIREGYEIDIAQGDHFFRNLKWLPTERKRDSELGNVPAYYRQLTSDTFGAFYCEGSTAPYTLSVEEDCEMETHKGDFKKRLLEEVIPSTCARTNTDGIIEYFANSYEIDEKYERQQTAKSVFGDAYESDFKSIEREYEVKKDKEDLEELLEELKDNDK